MKKFFSFEVLKNDMLLLVPAVGIENSFDEIEIVLGWLKRSISIYFKKVKIVPKH